MSICYWFWYWLFKELLKFNFFTEARWSVNERTSLWRLLGLSNQSLVIHEHLALIPLPWILISTDHMPTFHLNSSYVASVRFIQISPQTKRKILAFQAAVSTSSSSSHVPLSLWLFPSHEFTGWELNPAISLSAIQDPHLAQCHLVAAPSHHSETTKAEKSYQEKTEKDGIRHIEETKGQERNPSCKCPSYTKTELLTG